MSGHYFFDEPVKSRLSALSHITAAVQSVHLNNEYTSTDCIYNSVDYEERKIEFSGVDDTSINNLLRFLDDEFNKLFDVFDANNDDESKSIGQEFQIGSEELGCAKDECELADDCGTTPEEHNSTEGGESPREYNASDKYVIQGKFDLPGKFSHDFDPFEYDEEEDEVDSVGFWCHDESLVNGTSVHTDEPQEETAKPGQNFTDTVDFQVFPLIFKWNLSQPLRHGSELDTLNQVRYGVDDFAELSQTVQEFIDCYKNNYSAFSTLYKWQHPELSPMAPSIRQINPVYGVKGDIITNKYGRETTLKKQISNSSHGLKKVKYQPKGVKFDPAKKLAWPKSGRKSSPLQEYLPYFKEPTWKTVCPEVVGYGMKHKQKYYAKMIKKLVFEASRFNKINYRSGTLKQLFGKTHLYWLVFATQLLFHLKMDLSSGGIDDQILKISELLKFTAHNNKDNQLEELMCKKDDCFCQSNLEALTKEIRKMRKPHKVNIKCHPTKLFYPYKYDMRLMNHIGRGGKCDVSCKKGSRGKGNFCPKQTVSNPKMINERVELEHMIKNKGKKDNMSYKRFYRSVYDLEPKEIMSKYELGHFVSRSSGGKKLKIDFRRIKNDVLNLWDSEHENTSSIFQRQVDNALLYWYQKDLLTKNAMDAMSTQVADIFTTVCSITSHSHAPFLVLDNDDPLELPKERIWNGSIKTDIVQYFEDDEWESDDDFSYNVAQSPVTSPDRKYGIAGKNRHFWKFCKILHTHACLSIHQKLADKVTIPSFSNTKLYTYEIQHASSRDTHLDSRCCCDHPTCNSNSQICQLKRANSCHCRFQDMTSGVVQRRIPAVLSQFDGQKMNPVKQKLLFQYFRFVRLFEIMMIKGELLTRVRTSPQDLDFLNEKTNYYRELLDYLKTHTCKIISNQIRELLNQQRLCLKYKGRKHLLFRYCTDYIKFPLYTEVTNMTIKEVMEFLSHPGHPFYSYILVTPQLAQERKEMSKKIMKDLHEIHKVESFGMFKELKARQFYRGVRKVCDFENWWHCDDYMLAKKGFLIIEKEAAVEEGKDEMKEWVPQDIPAELSESGVLYPSSSVLSQNAGDEKNSRSPSSPADDVKGRRIQMVVPH